MPPPHKIIYIDAQSTVNDVWKGSGGFIAVGVGLMEELC